MIKDNAPFFYVKDIVKAAEFYREVLGFDFETLWGEPPTFCMPTRDGFTVMLQQKEADKIVPNGKYHDWDAYFWVTDADKLFNEFKSKGVRVEYEPVIKELYNMKEFAIYDLDGYLLAFGQNWEGK